MSREKAEVGELDLGRVPGPRFTGHQKPSFSVEPLMRPSAYQHGGQPSASSAQLWKFEVLTCPVFSVLQLIALIWEKKHLRTKANSLL